MFIPEHHFSDKGSHEGYQENIGPVQFNWYKTGTLYVMEMKDKNGKNDKSLATYDFIPQEDFQTTLQFELDNLYDKVMSKAGLVKQVTDLLATAFDDADGYSTRYRNIPAQKSFSCVINDSVTLNFRYGLYRKYDAKVEVVNPICKLVKEFAPKLYYNEKNTTDKDNFLVKGPYASTARILKGAIDKDSSPGVITEWAKIENLSISTAINKFEETVEKSLAGTNMKYLNIRVGKFTWKYIVPKSIGWKFDTSNVDEKGNPMSGQITLSGLQFIYAPVQLENEPSKGFFSFGEGNIGDLRKTDSSGDGDPKETSDGQNTNLSGSQ